MSQDSPQGIPHGVPKKRTNPLAVVLILSAVFFVLFLMISAALFLSRGSSTEPRWANWETGETRSMFQGGGGGGAIAVLELKGVILDSKKLLAQLKRAAKDDYVRGVVLRLNSPGGAVAPSQEIYDAVKKFPKPLVASMASVAASGAYYIACGSKKVYSNPGTITGSIGVIMEFANLEKLYQWAKIERYSIKTGKFKDAGADHRSMTPEERKLLQAMVDDVLSQFKQAVVEGRGLKPAEVDRVADGRIFSGAQAKAAGLIDELGGIEDAISAAAKLAKIEGEPRVIYPEGRRSWLRDVFMDSSGDEEEEAAYGLVPRFFGALFGKAAAGPWSGSLSGAAGSQALFGPGIYWLWNGS